MADNDTKVNDKLDEYLLKTLEELWKIVTDQKHPDHKRFKLDALKLLLRHTAPIRKENAPPPSPVIVPPPTTPPESGPDISIQIANLFHSNSIDEIEDKSKDVKVIDVKKE